MGLDELLVIVLQQNLLGSPSANERAEGLGILMEKVSVSYGAAGSNLGHLLRASGVPVPLTALLSDVDLAMRNQALWIIGNLCSDSVDVDSALTKQALMAAGADKVLFGCLDEEATLELACAALSRLRPASPPLSSHAAPGNEGRLPTPYAPRLPVPCAARRTRLAAHTRCLEL